MTQNTNIQNAISLLERSGYAIVRPQEGSRPRHTRAAGMDLYRHLCALASGPDGLHNMARSPNIATARLGRYALELGRALHADSSQP